MNSTALQFALRELRARFSDPRTYGVLAIVVMALALAGPFGTFAELSLLARFGYWALTAFATYGIGLGVGLFTLALVRPRTGSRALQLLAIALAAALPVALVVTGINVALVSHQWPAAPSFLELLLNCFFIVLGIAIILGLVRRETGKPAASAAPDAPEPPAILRRLPLAQRGALLYMSMQDHYVDVVTDKGHALVLMRLSDAMEETGSVRGLQVHRSHWVALDAVRSATRQEGRASLVMADGASIPVSRANLAAAREAGLL